MFRLLGAVASAATLLPLGLIGQDAGPGTGGLVRLAQEQRALATPYRVLVIGAHPDDEDTELITILSRGYGAETGYLSLTRGEGGQNLIGGELGAALGVLRSGELLASRRLDGARQFFTRAFDFGFSKSPDEAFRTWSRDTLVKDVVRVIRRFRPDVVISTWLGTPADGHGHHQAAGIVSLDAYRAAGDPGRFPELATEEGLDPWRPAKFYRNRGVPAGTGITLDGGSLAPGLGISLHQLAMRARSRHRSQDMGQLEEPGPSSVRIGLEEVAPGIPTQPGDSLFAGLPAAMPTDDTRRHRAALRTAERGVVLDAYVDDHEVTAGQSVTLTVVAWNTGTAPVAVGTSWQLPGVEAEASDPDCRRPRRLAPGELFTCTTPMRVGPAAPVSQPYYLRQPPIGARYQWEGPSAAWSDPFEPTPWRVRTALEWDDGARADAITEVTARSLDQGLGEVRRPVSIVPAVLVDLAPGTMLWPAGLGSREFTVTIEHAAREAVEATVGLVVPDGWQVDPPRPVHLVAEGERRTLQFTVRPPAGLAAGVFTLRAEAVIAGTHFDRAIRRVEYPHVAPRSFFEPAAATVTMAPVVFASGRRVGYLRGAADAIPEALAAAGVPLRLLTSEDLEGSTLDSLDVVVIGPRAYEVDDAVRRAHPRLLAFTEAGGTLITQYQQYQYVNGGYAPHPFTIDRPHDRVTDETAPVRFLAGSEGLRSGPNRLTDADFQGWVQERGLYFADSWDARWTPLLASHDPGEEDQLGGLLVAGYGRGTVVYTGLSFFREIPAAVPGAWRLFANLLALGGR